MTPEQIIATAEALRAIGVPDILNRWLTLTPEEWAENEKARERYRKQLHTAVLPRAPKMTERARARFDLPRAIEPAGRVMLREMRVAARRRQREKDRLKKEKAMTTKKQTAQAETTAPVEKTRRTRAPAKTAQRNPARKKVEPKEEKAIRPGTKLEAVAKLLTRKDGCTTKEVLDATGWPAVSMPQQAKAAGLTLRKERKEGVTRYYGTQA